MTEAKMIRYLKHTEIDKSRWDACISGSSNSMIYAYSWYLDAASPGWEALVADDYSAVFPLTHRKKFFRYLYQPFFTQQLGLFSAHLSTALLLEFINAIPRTFRFIEIQLNEKNELLPEEDERIKKRKNFLLDLQGSYESLYKNYSEHTKRNLKKTAKDDLRIRDIESDLAVDFYIRHKSHVTSSVQLSDYRRLRAILHKAKENNMLQCFGVYDAAGTLLVTAALFITKDRLCLINNCASPAGRDARGMYLLVDRIIRDHAGTDRMLDFEGSDVPGISRFNKGFGACKVPYYRLRINRLPWYIKWLKN